MSRPAHILHEALDANGDGIPDNAFQVSSLLGDNSSDATTEIQNAIDAANAAGGGKILISSGTYLVSGLTFYNKIYFEGEGYELTIIKLIAESNTDVFYGDGSNELFGTSPSGDPGLNKFGFSNLTIDGNKDNNTSGHGISVYGRDFVIDNVLIKDVAEHGLNTEWRSVGEPDTGMEASISRVHVIGVGKHGWRFGGPHDTHVNDMFVINASEAADDTYDGVYIDQNGGGRFHQLHTWSFGGVTNRYRYGVNVQAGGNFFSQCYLEGAKTANLLINNNNQVFTGGRLSASTGSYNLILDAAVCVVSDVYMGAKSSGNVGNVCAVQLGSSGGEYCADNQISILIESNLDGAFDFTYSDGGNYCFATGFNGSGGTTHAGSPNATDTVHIDISGAGGGILTQFPETMTFTGNIEAGSLPTSDQNDGVSLWVDTGASNVIKLSSTP